MPKLLSAFRGAPGFQGTESLKRLTSQLWSIKLRDVGKVVTYHFSVQSRHSPGRHEENDREFKWR